ncbi:MAG: hypothetical protein K2X77_08390 [Candidatus Obscuribacterales bacterium]|nr:hypothetical protein [Candidatus Obscuribacterales bacterium]
MRRILITTTALSAFSLICAGPTLADKVNPNRNSPISYVKSPAAPASRYKPLTGKIDYREPQTPSSYIQGKPRLQGGNSQNQLQGRSNQNKYDSGVNDEDYVRPYSAVTPQYDNFNRPFDLQAQNQRIPGDVSDKQLNLLRSHDVVIMQDRSSSMGEKEYFPQGKFSRWKWCLFQASDFARQTSKIRNWAFDVVLFSNEYDVFRGVRLPQIPEIYDRSGIYIGTRLAQPLQEQLSQYFQRRASGNAKPLMIAVVTDGKPQDDEDLCDVIINATHHIANPNDLHITFLQIGTDDEGQKKLNKLDYKLVRKGARFDIVSVMPYNMVTQLGLARSIVQAMETAPN